MKEVDIEKVKNTGNQKKKMGGHREGSGRKRIYADPKLKRNFSDFVSNEKLMELVEIALKKAKKDSIMLRFVLEQGFGKAPQALGVTFPEGIPLNSILDKVENGQ